jgi:hypothetical protein
MDAKWEVYTRELDAGNCTQVVITLNGEVVSQSLDARQGWYTGDGNPGVVGKQIADLHGYGFHKLQAVRRRDAILSNYYFSLLGEQNV